MIRRSLLLSVVLLGCAGLAVAQDQGTLDPKPLPPLANPKDPKTPAKELFGRKPQPTHAAPRSIGFYAAGCLDGGQALPINGDGWQVMRLSRNRNWGHPTLITFLEHLAAKAKTAGWPGLLVGDMSQPRGGPMITGHASHQVGLDADIWLTPMPNHELSRAEREEMSAKMMVREDRLDIDPAVWSNQTTLIKQAAQDPRVERVFVNAAIKKALCREAGGDRHWLAKVRPWWGHDFHFHVRISCPADSPLCKPQPPVGEGEGCGKKDLDYWFSEGVLHPKPPPVPPKPRPQMTMAQLPPACRQVLDAPAR